MRRTISYQVGGGAAAELEATTTNVFAVCQILHRRDVGLPGAAPGVLEQEHGLPVQARGRVCAPVLVVPRAAIDAAAAATGPVLVAYDGSSGADTALAAVTRLWPSRRIVVASVASRAAEEVVSVAGIERVGLEAEGVAETARSVADALALHAAAIGAAAITVGSRGRSAHREILLGSVAIATLHHAHRPVLAVPAPNRLAQ